jgi:hypothetical protein
MRAPKRYTLLLCLMHRMQGRTRADLVEMLLKRMATMHKPARATRLDIQARQRAKRNLSSLPWPLCSMWPGQQRQIQRRSSGWSRA